jgi:peptidoglycan hydrolase-like protein with peptidoglycan-binding domain
VIDTLKTSLRGRAARRIAYVAGVGGARGRRWRIAATAATLLLAGLLASLPGRAGALGAQQGAVPVAQQYDPVRGGYERVVVEPLPSAAMRAVQLALAHAGERGLPLTGVVDRPTRDALRDFQSTNGLRITGRPDYETVLALGVPVRRATRAEVARAIEEAARRPHDIVVIGPSDTLAPSARGLGVPPAGAAPSAPGAGARPVPEPGVAPTPEPGVEPVPAPGVQGLPAPASQAPQPPPGAPAPEPPPQPTSLDSLAAPAPGTDSILPR